MKGPRISEAKPDEELENMLEDIDGFEESSFKKYKDNPDDEREIKGPQISKAKPDEELENVLEEIDGFKESSFKKYKDNPDDEERNRNSIDKQSGDGGGSSNRHLVTRGLPNSVARKSNNTIPEIDSFDDEDYDESNSKRKKLSIPNLFKKKKKGDYKIISTSNNDEDLSYDPTNIDVDDDEYQDEHDGKQKSTSSHVYSNVSAADFDPMDVDDDHTKLKKMNIGQTNKKETKKKFMLCALYFTPLLILLIIGIVVGVVFFSSYDWRKKVMIKPPPKNFEVKCGDTYIDTLGNREECINICKHAECCLVEGEGSCFSDEPNCLLYSNCVDIYSEVDDVNIPTVDQSCITSHMTSKKGREKCDKACSAGKCCFDDSLITNCKTEKNKFCRQYEKCSILSHYSDLDQVANTENDDKFTQEELHNLEDPFDPVIEPIIESIIEHPLEEYDTNDENNQKPDHDDDSLYYLPKITDEEMDSMLNIRDEFDSSNLDDELKSLSNTDDGLDTSNYYEEHLDALSQEFPRYYLNDDKHENEFDHTDYSNDDTYYVAAVDLSTFCSIKALSTVTSLTSNAGLEQCLRMCKKADCCLRKGGFKCKSYTNFCLSYEVCEKVYAFKDQRQYDNMNHVKLKPGH